MRPGRTGATSTGHDAPPRASTSAPIRLTPGLRKTLVLLVLCLAFATIGVLMVRDGEAAGYGVAFVFGLGALVAAVLLLPGSSYLEITEEGLTVSSLFRKSFVPWRHVREFVPVTMHFKAMVGWNYSAEFKGGARARQLSVAIAGVEAALPDTYGMKAEGLSLLLNELLAQSRREA